MLEFFARLFSIDFAPHAYCLRNPSLVYAYAWANATIALSYYLIPLTLAYIVLKKRDLAFDWMFGLFGIFILACGTTHILDVVTLWYPVYRFGALITIITAAASLSTSILLVRLVPQIRAIPSPSELQHEVLERRSAEEAIRTLNQQLEGRIEKRTAELQRSNEDLRQFAYTAAHDLQEPLRMMSVYSQLLKRRYGGQIDADADSQIEAITDNAKRMTMLINDLLDYSRVMGIREENENLPPIDADAALLAVLDALAPQIQAINADIRKHRLPAVCVPPAHLIQVLQNLIGNSLKYCEPGRTAVIEIGAEPCHEPHLCRLFVKDNGIGIAPQYHKQIWGVFKRLHGRAVPGTGIGLAICQKIVERYGGRIWVESEEGSGATFVFELPTTATRLRLDS